MVAMGGGDSRVLTANLTWYLEDRKGLRGSGQEGGKMPCTPPVHQISRFILDIRSHRYFSKICSIYIGNETGKTENWPKGAFSSWSQLHKTGTCS